MKQSRAIEGDYSDELNIGFEMHSTNALTHVRDESGRWFRTAPDNGAWGNGQFLERSLLYVESAVLHQVEGLWSNWWRRKAEVRRRLLPHLRYVDLKAKEGQGKADACAQHLERDSRRFLVGFSPQSNEP